MCSTGWHSGGELYEHKVVKRALGRTVSAIVHALVDVRMCALKLLWVTWQIQARKDYDTGVYAKYLCSRISIYIYIYIWREREREREREIYIYAEAEVKDINAHLKHVAPG